MDFVSTEFVRSSLGFFWSTLGFDLVRTGRLTFIEAAERDENFNEHDRFFISTDFVFVCCSLKFVIVSMVTFFLELFFLVDKRNRLDHHSMFDSCLRHCQYNHRLIRSFHRPRHRPFQNHRNRLRYTRRST